MSTLNRRRFLKCATATAAVAYGFSQSPLVFGQEGSNGIDCGTVVTVPTFTGAVDQSWIGDTNDYRANGITQIFGQTDQYPLEGHLRTKFDEYTWFGIEIPINKSQGAEQLQLVFDTKNTGSEDGGADGVYNLVLETAPNGFREIESVPGIESPSPSDYYAGTPFFQGFQSTNGLRLEICFCSF